MVTLSEDEPEPVERGPLTRLVIICLASYLGYGILGGWCYLVEQQHEATYEEKKVSDPNFHGKGPVLELRAALGLIIFSLIRIFTLLIFCFEKGNENKNADRISILWLSLSTLLMMTAYFTACLNLNVFFDIHPSFLTLFFICIALDFAGNVLILVRNSPA